MKLLRITNDLHANLASATMVWFEDKAIRFYIPGSDITLDDRAVPLPGIRFETAMMTENDLVVWVQPEHPKFKAVQQWIAANSF